jgi:hypothetical protein
MGQIAIKSISKTVTLRINNIILSKISILLFKNGRTRYALKEFLENRICGE